MLKNGPMLQRFFEVLELRLSMFQSLRGLTASQIQSDLNLIETAYDMISSYIYIYIYIYILEVGGVSQL